MVNDNKVNDEKNKPPQKPRRTREEVLKQLNEELRANANRAGKRIKQGGLDEQH